ncbi:YlbF family regulator [Clostridium ganghwense]|uniref:YlbF family regulator n=1 Tax=Clostridium ganghwense TaxID=312089 RepID=UPI00300E38DB
MNVYDKVHELANVLKDCDEVKKFREASKKIETNDKNKKMLDDFRKIQFQAYSEQIEKR